MSKSHFLMVGKEHPTDLVQEVARNFGGEGNVAGDGENPVDPQKADGLLQAADETNHLHYWGHGVKGKTSRLAKKTHYTEVFELEPTATMLARHKHIPGIRHVWACYGGQAQEAVKELGENVPLILHSGPDFSTLVAMNAATMMGLANFGKYVEQQYGRPMDAYDAFEYCMLTSPETMVFLEMKEGKVQRFPYRCPKQAAGDDSLRNYLDTKLAEFRQFRQEKLGHDKTTFLPIGPTNEALTNYRNQAMLMEAGRGGSKKDIERVEGYLKLGVDVDTTFLTDVTALHVTASFGHAGMVKCLLGYGAEPDMRANNGVTPLMAAAEKGHLSVTKLLFESRADHNIYNNDGMTALTIAALKGHLPVVSFLVQNGVDVNQRGKNDATPLQLACQEGHTEMARFLVNAGADITSADRNGTTPLHIAAEKANFEEVAHLLKRGAYHSPLNNNGDTPLHSVARFGQNEHLPPEFVAECQIHVAGLLTDAGANVHQPNNAGMTPLHYAAMNGHVEMVKFLMDKGAEINRADNANRTALHYAVASGHTDVIELLLARKADVTLVDNARLTPLMAASKTGQKEAIGLLMKHGVDINEAKGFETALSVAKDEETATLLLEKGADIACGSWNGALTALMTAVVTERKDLVALILQHPDANLNYLQRKGSEAFAHDNPMIPSMDKEEFLGKTALELASGNREIRGMIQDAICFEKMPAAAKIHGREAFMELRQAVLGAIPRFNRDREEMATDILFNLYNTIPNQPKGEHSARLQQNHPLNRTDDNKVIAKDNWQELARTKVERHMRETAFDGRSGGRS